MATISLNIVRILIGALVLLAIYPIQAKEIVHGSMGQDEIAKMGQCLPFEKVTAEEAKDILANQKIKVSANITKAELSALGTGIKQIQNLYGGQFPGVQGANFKYANEATNWNQSSGPIKVNRYWANDRGMNSSNIAMLIHELGHYVGNNSREGNPATYNRYFKAVPEPCRFSWYAKNRRKEEFADVFSTMVVNPENLLKSDDLYCRKAYNFFKAEIFSKGELAQCKAEDDTIQKPRKKQPKQEPPPETKALDINNSAR